MARKRPYKVPNIVLEKSSNTEELDRIETIETLDDIATLQPGKNAQLAAKKISEKHKKMRETNKRKNKFKLPGEIVRIETVETSQEVSRFLFLLKNQNQVFVQLKLKSTRKQEENKLKKREKK